MNQYDRVQDFIKKYQQLKPEEKITSLSTIKGQTIERICQFDSDKPYRRLLKWVENKIKDNAIEKVQAESPKLFDKPVKEKKIRKAKKSSFEVQGIEIPELLLSDILTNFKIGKLTFADTVFIIKQHYKQ